jgi:serine protease Do
VRYVYAISSAIFLGGAVHALALANPSAVPFTAFQGSPIVVPRTGAPVSFADMVEKLQPAVVNIATRQKVSFQVGGRQGQQDQNGGGSGFFISSDGLIVTNNHVISGGPNNAPVDSIVVTLIDQREFTARIIGRDPTSDIALLKIDAQNMPFVKFGDSTRTRVGEWVVAIGNPLGLGSTVTAGIVSALQRNIGAPGPYDRFIQTDTAINPGNSGGPLFNMQGQVVGINNRLIGPQGANIGINFAIPSDAAIPVVETLRNGATVKRGYLGVAPAPVDEDLAASVGLPKNQGEILQRVEPGEPADKAGLRVGDIVLRVGGKPVTPQQSLSFLVANNAPGTRLALDIVRDGKRSTINAVVGTRPSDDELAKQRTFNRDEQPPMDPKQEDTDSQGDDGAVRKYLGIDVTPITPAIANDLGYDAQTKGLVILAVGQNSDAANRGLQRGDVILSAQYKPTLAIKDLADQIALQRKEKRPTILLQMRRQGVQSAFIAVKLLTE